MSNTVAHEKDGKKPMPAPLEFMLRTPLYEWYALPSTAEWNALAYLPGRHDIYCIYCKQVTLFERKSFHQGPAHLATTADAYVTHGWRRIQLVCLKSDHSYDFWILVSPSGIVKVGQYPSLADLHIADRRKYLGLLGRERTAELMRADGLAAHGVGIGSFVYLRRIFESLVEEAHLREKARTDWREEEYQRSRMDEKIQLLAHELPEFLVAHRSIYGVLSKGIHELSEQECLAFHSAIRTGIEIILDERLEMEARAKRLADARSALMQAADQAKGHSNPK